MLRNSGLIEGDIEVLESIVLSPIGEKTPSVEKHIDSISFKN